MTENYWYYNPSSDCNTVISQYDYDRLSKEDKQKYQRLDGSPNGRVYIDKENLIAENQRLKIQNNKMKRLLKDLDYWLGQELNLNCFKGEIMSLVLSKDYIMEEKKKKIEEVLKKVEE